MSDTSNDTSHRRSEIHTEKIGANLEKSIAKTLKGFCRARGESISTVVRRSIRRELARHSYLDQSEKKALGVDSDE